MNPGEHISGFNLSFDQGIAQSLGVEAAIIFNHIVYWLRINAAKPNAQMIEEKYWMYETQSQMAEFFGFMIEETVNKYIKKLCDAGLIIKKCLSTNPFDRTYSYTVYDQSLIVLKKSLRNTEKPCIENRQNRASETRQNRASKNDKTGYVISTENNTTEEKKEKQLQQVAVSFENQEIISYPCKPFIPEQIIFECLKDVEISPNDKIEISKNYQETIVKNAVAWAIHPETKINKSLVAAIKWACQNKPEVPATKEDLTEKNKKFAKKFDGLTKGSYEVNVLSQFVEIDFKNSYKQPFILNYTENGFQERLLNELRKNGFKI